MLFCPKCGHILTLKDEKKKKLVCLACGYSTKEKKEVKLKEKVEKARKIEVVDQKMSTLPKITIDCPKCGHKEAYYWTMQTRAADEAETRFFECVKCGHRWREYK